MPTIVFACFPTQSPYPKRITTPDPTRLTYQLGRGPCGKAERRSGQVGIRASSSAEIHRGSRGLASSGKKNEQGRTCCVCGLVRLLYFRFVCNMRHACTLTFTTTTTYMIGWIAPPSLDTEHLSTAPSSPTKSLPSLPFCLSTPLSPLVVLLL